MRSTGRAAAAARLSVLIFVARLLHSEVLQSPLFACGRALCTSTRPPRTVGDLRPPARQTSQVTVRARRPGNSGADGAIKGGLGGAVLGGLLLGPFGAVFGAQLGADWGRQKAQDEAAIEELGLDTEMVQLAQRVTQELLIATQDRERVASTRDDLAARAQTLEAEVEAKYSEAMEAVKAENDELARQVLAAKQSAQGRLDTVKADLLKAEQRCATMERNVEQLERRALQVNELLERARMASGSERTALTAEASGLGVSAPHDPLLDRFDALERGER
mmetsp:Transcript_44946/g.90691  ORF Transcript_44946/g.90691 Transcript_44946/m.90691 type:complete len:277 (-) Transcript_44946:139-969(-)